MGDHGGQMTLARWKDAKVEVAEDLEIVGRVAQGCEKRPPAQLGGGAVQPLSRPNASSMLATAPGLEQEVL